MVDAHNRGRSQEQWAGDLEYSEAEIPAADAEAIAALAVQMHGAYMAEAGFPDRKWISATLTDQRSWVRTAQGEYYAAKQRAANTKELSFTDDELIEGALIQRCTNGSRADQASARQQFVIRARNEQGMSHAEAVAHLETKLREVGVNGIGDYGPPQFKQPKALRKALKAAAVEGKVALAPKAVTSSAGKSADKSNPYTWPKDTPEQRALRHAELVKLASNPTLATALARAAGCTISGSPLKR